MKKILLAALAILSMSSMAFANDSTATDTTLPARIEVPADFVASTFISANNHPVFGGSLMYQGKGISAYSERDSKYGADFQTYIPSPWHFLVMSVPEKHFKPGEPFTDSLIWMVRNTALVGQLGMIHTDANHLGGGVKMQVFVPIQDVVIEAGWHSNLGITAGFGIKF